MKITESTKVRLYAGIAAVALSMLATATVAQSRPTVPARQALPTVERPDRVTACPKGETFADGRCLRLPLQSGPRLRVELPAERLKPVAAEPEGELTRAPLEPVAELRDPVVLVRRCEDGTRYGSSNRETGAYCDHGELVFPCEEGATNEVGEVCFQGVWYPTCSGDECLGS